MRGQLYSLTDACEWHLGKKNLAKLRSLMLDFPKFMLELPTLFTNISTFILKYPTLVLEFQRLK